MKKTSQPPGGKNKLVHHRACSGATSPVSFKVGMHRLTNQSTIEAELVAVAQPMKCRTSMSVFVHVCRVCFGVELQSSKLRQRETR